MRSLSATAVVVGAATLFTLGSPLAASASGTTFCAGKQEWPELVGTNAILAQKVIKWENPNVTETTLIPEDSLVTMDYRCDRVRIRIDEESDPTVAVTPSVG